MRPPARLLLCGVCVGSWSSLLSSAELAVPAHRRGDVSILEAGRRLQMDKDAGAACTIGELEGEREKSVWLEITLAVVIGGASGALVVMWSTLGRSNRENQRLLSLLHAKNVEVEEGFRGLGQVAAAGSRPISPRGRADIEASASDPLLPKPWVQQPLLEVDTHEPSPRGAKEFVASSAGRRGSVEPVLPDVQRAALHVLDATDGVARIYPRPGAIPRYAHVLYMEILPAVQLIIVGLVLLTFFEKPLWCNDPETKRIIETPCENAMYPSYPIQYLTEGGNFMAETLLFLPILGHSVLLWYAQGEAYFVKTEQESMEEADYARRTRGRQRVRMLFNVLYILDMLYGYLTPVYYFRMAPYLRIGFVVLYSHATRDRLRLVFSTLPDVLNIFVLIVGYLAFFAWMGVLIFPYGGDENKQYFDGLPDGMWSLYILLTTANFPDVMMPVYKQTRLACLFFVFFIVFGVFFLMNLLTAVVFNAYKRQVEENRQLHNSHKQLNLSCAFELICQKPASGRKYVTWETMSTLFTELNHYQDIAFITEEDAEKRFQRLDRSQDNSLPWEEFCELTNELATLMHDEPPPPFLERRLRGLRTDPGWLGMKAMVSSRTFDAWIDAILVVNIGITVIQTWDAICGRIGSTDEVRMDWAWNLADGLFTFFYVVEAALKILVFGFVRYWRDLKNRFDFIITVATAVVAIYIYIPNDLNEATWIHYVSMVRLLRILRLLFSLDSFRVIMKTGVAMLPNALAILKVLFCVMYVFAVLGNQVFGGLINTDPSSPFSTPLNASDYGQAGYYPNNFNDMPSAIMTLFELLVVNNWFVLAHGFALTAGNGAYLYFVVFHILCVVVCLNVVVSFILDTFMEEYEQNLERLQDGGEDESHRRERPEDDLLYGEGG